MTGLDYAAPTTPSGTGIGTMVKDFVRGNAVTSFVGTAIAEFCLFNVRGYGFEIIVILVLPVAVIVLNVLMAGVVHSAAVLKQRSLKRPVSVTPRLHMFYLGLAAAPVTAAIGWCAMMMIPDVLVGIPCALAIGSAPVAIATWMLARPRP